MEDTGIVVGKAIKLVHNLNSGISEPRFLKDFSTNDNSALIWDTSKTSTKMKRASALFMACCEASSVVLSIIHVGVNSAPFKALYSYV